MANLETKRDVWGANEYEDIVKRNVEWMQEFVVLAVRALRRDGRPLGTSRMTKAQHMQSLLEAGPEFWDALKMSDPALAARLGAEMVEARAQGKVPPVGPRVGEAIQIEEARKQQAQTGTERSRPIPPIVSRSSESVM